MLSASVLYHLLLRRTLQLSVLYSAIKLHKELIITYYLTNFKVINPLEL
jgi:hypothetical protein